MAGRFPLEMQKKKSVEPLSRDLEQCRANSELSFEMSLTLSLQWLCKGPFSQLTSFQLVVLLVLIAGRFPLERQKKTVEPRSREQCRTNSELSFGLGSTLSLQWLCKIPFSQLTSFQLTVLIAGRFPLERQKKKNLLNRVAGICNIPFPQQWFCKIPFPQLTLYKQVFCNMNVLYIHSLCNCAVCPAYFFLVALWPWENCIRTVCPAYFFTFCRLND